ncbi:GyrI-like domain-containing protein [Spirillospora sp. NPDC052269]
MTDAPTTTPGGPTAMPDTTTTMPGARNAAPDAWYAATDEPTLVELDAVRGLSVSGLGDPEGPEYGAAIEAMYAVAAAMGTPGMPLEARWWVEDERPPLEVPRSEWRWHMFLKASGEITAEQVERARDAVRPKLPAAGRVQLVEFAEGPSVQVLHHGAYADEPATLGRMYAFMGERNIVPRGLHHEIYLSLGELTILRQPVLRVDPGANEA